MISISASGIDNTFYEDYYPDRQHHMGISLFSSNYSAPSKPSGQDSSF